MKRWMKHHIPPYMKAPASIVWNQFQRDPSKKTTDLLLDLVFPNDNFDFIHCHDLSTLPAGVSLKERMPNAKLIYDAHELYPHQYPHGSIQQRYWSRIEHRFISSVDLVITINESIAEEMQNEYGIEKPRIIYNSCESVGEVTAVDRATFLSYFSAPLSIECAILFQGSIGSTRNLEHLTLAMRELPDTTGLFYLGQGDYLSHIKKMVRKHRIHNVFFGGHLPQTSLLRYVAAADFGVIPYVECDLKNNLYCTPNKLFEYIEACVPICVSNLPELSRFVVGNGIGRSYEMLSTGQIASALKDCVAALQAGEFALPARNAAREKFCWNRQAELLLSLYKQLVG